MDQTSNQPMGRPPLKRYACALLIFVIAELARAAPDTKGAFDGEWRTSIGIVTLKQTGNTVNGTYGNTGQFTMKGTVAGRKLTFEYQENQAAGDGSLTLDESGHSFQG